MSTPEDYQAILAAHAIAKAERVIEEAESSDDDD